MKRLYTLIVTGLLLFGATMSSHGEDYALWNDNAYDFTKVRTIYVDELNTAPAAIHSPAKEQLMKEDFAKKATTEKWKQTKFIVAPVALPMQDDQTTPATETQPTPAGQHATVKRKNVTTADPGAGIASTEPATPPLPAPEATEVLPAPTKDMHIAVPDAAKAAEADLYIKGDVLSYGVGTGLIPAHTEWNTYQISDVYYDRDGHPHWYTRNISYPIYVPARYVPIASVAVRFTVVDVQTGNVVSVSEDTRDRGSSSDTRGVYNRIIDRFFKNLKKQVQP